MATNFKSSKPTSEFDGHLSGKKVVAKQASGAVHAVKTTGLSTGAPQETVLLDSHETLHKGVTAPAEHLCQVTVGGGMTIPTEPFANVKILVSVTIPCNGKNALDDTYEFASSWVSEKLEKATQDIKG